MSNANSGVGARARSHTHAGVQVPCSARPVCEALRLRVLELYPANAAKQHPGWHSLPRICAAEDETSECLHIVVTLGTWAAQISNGRACDVPRAATILLSVLALLDTADDDGIRTFDPDSLYTAIKPRGDEPSFEKKVVGLNATLRPFQVIFLQCPV